MCVSEREKGGGGWRDSSVYKTALVVDNASISPRLPLLLLSSPLPLDL